MKDLSCSNVKKRKVIVILYLKIGPNNDTLTLFSANILTNKNVIQVAKRIRWTKKLKVSQGLIQ